MSEPVHPAPPQTAGRSALRRSGSFLVRHRVGTSWALILLLLVIVVLQNVEPTTVDLLFWSLPEVPKLVLIVSSMLLGAALWEGARRLLFKQR